MSTIEFSPREEQVLMIALRCLKGGPPDIDMEKLKELGGFNTLKTATNTWSAIKKKLSMTDENGDPLPVAPKKPAGEPSTPKPKKVAATPGSKKRGKKVAAADDSDSEAGTSLSRAKKIKTPMKKEEEDSTLGDDEV